MNTRDDEFDNLILSEYDAKMERSHKRKMPKTINVSLKDYVGLLIKVINQMNVQLGPDQNLDVVNLLNVDSKTKRSKMSYDDDLENECNSKNTSLAMDIIMNALTNADYKFEFSYTNLVFFLTTHSIYINQDDFVVVKDKKRDDKRKNSGGLILNEYAKAPTQFRMFIYNSEQTDVEALRMIVFHKLTLPIETFDFLKYSINIPQTIIDKKQEHRTTHAYLNIYQFKRTTVLMTNKLVYFYEKNTLANASSLEKEMLMEPMAKLNKYPNCFIILDVLVSSKVTLLDFHYSNIESFEWTPSYRKRVEYLKCIFGNVLKIAPEIEYDENCCTYLAKGIDSGSDYMYCKPNPTIAILGYKNDVKNLIVGVMNNDVLEIQNNHKFELGGPVIHKLSIMLLDAKLHNTPPETIMICNKKIDVDGIPNDCHLTDNPIVLEVKDNKLGEESDELPSSVQFIKQIGQMKEETSMSKHLSKLLKNPIGLVNAFKADQTIFHQYFKLMESTGIEIKP